jgi:flagellar biosynthesis chaperone FliJ
MPADRPLDPDTLLDLGDANPEDLGEEVQKTNTELENLKRKLEDIERQKQKLEELKRRQEELEDGRAEMLDKLTRSLGTVQRESEETHKRLEQLQAIQNSFTQHLRYIDSINPKLWGATELPRELSKAISAVEDARADYVKAQAKIAVESPAADVPVGYEGDYAAPEERGFGYWLRSGFAFTLPLQVLGWCVFVAWLLQQLGRTP